MITGSTANTSSSTLGSDYESPQENEPSIGGFTYGIGVTVGILVLITTITVTSYFCSRDPGPSPAEGQPQGQQQGRDHVIDMEGIDADTLKSYPKCLYSELENNSKRHESGTKKGSTQNSCSICLGNYKGSDLVRELGECGHVFHLKCVDSWLRLHPTCPLCRTSPLPTPQSTPLVEVIPLASSLRGV